MILFNVNGIKGFVPFSFHVFTFVTFVHALLHRKQSPFDSQKLLEFQHLATWISLRFKLVDGFRFGNEFCLLGTEFR